LHQGVISLTISQSMDNTALIGEFNCISSGFGTLGCQYIIWQEESKFLFICH
jgi:hypothetical protein